MVLDAAIRVEHLMNNLTRMAKGFGCMLLAFACIFAEEDPHVKIFPLSVGAVQEFGLITKGFYTAGGNSAYSSLRTTENDWIDHFGAFMSEKAVVNDRLFISAGLGGVFQFRKPEVIEVGYHGSQRKGFFIGPSTEAVYHFGDLEKPWLQLGMGNFWYKYNPDASNLGEYLFRSGAYPTYTYTGGYTTIGSAGAQLQGFKGLLSFGDFKADLFFTTETNLAPFYNWSPAAVLSYSLRGGLLDLGAGVNFKNLIQVKPSRSTKHINENGYYQYQGKWYYASSQYYNNRSQFYLAHGDTVQANTEQLDFSIVDSLAPLPDSLKPGIQYFDASSILLTARATLDLKKVFNFEMAGSQDLKLYAELGVLGTKNYPIFYKKTSERMPFMAGFNIPTFKILDLCAVQVEYLNSPWLNNTYALSFYPANVPFLPQPQDSIQSQKDYNDITARDNFKWSLLLKKSFGAMTFSAQVASDHLRLPSSSYYYGPQFDPNEITVLKDSWYWMTQISWGL